MARNRNVVCALRMSSSQPMVTCCLSSLVIAERRELEGKIIPLKSRGNFIQRSLRRVRSEAG